MIDTSATSVVLFLFFFLFSESLKETIRKLVSKCLLNSIYDGCFRDCCSHACKGMLHTGGWKTSGLYMEVLVFISSDNKLSFFSLGA